MLHAGLRNDICVETRERIRPETIQQKAIAIDAVIEHCNHSTLWRCLQP